MILDAEREQARPKVKPLRSLETPPTPLYRGEPAMDIQMNKILDITINDFKVSLNREI